MNDIGWRKPTLDDIKRGTILRLGSCERDGAYCMCTIISAPDPINLDHHVEGRDLPLIFVKVARPMAYASENFNESQPHLYCEVFEISLSRLLDKNADYEVFQGRDGVRSMTT